MFSVRFKNVGTWIKLVYSTNLQKISWKKISSAEKVFHWYFKHVELLSWFYLYILLLLLCFLIRQIARLFMVQTVQFSSNIMIGDVSLGPLVLQPFYNEFHSKNSLRECWWFKKITQRSKIGKILQQTLSLLKVLLGNFSTALQKHFF